MVKINGVKATESSQTEKNVLPSMNEILDRMENNFEARKINYSNIDSSNLFNDTNNNQKVSTFGNFDLGQQTNDLKPLLNILPMLLSKDKSFKNNQNEIIKMLIKKSNNPMLSKLFELLPKLSKVKNAEAEIKNNETKKEKNIDDFVKAEDFQNKEN